MLKGTKLKSGRYVVFVHSHMFKVERVQSPDEHHNGVWWQLSEYFGDTTRHILFYRTKRAAYEGAIRCGVFIAELNSKSPSL